MAHFYGTVKGSRGEASRLGGKPSGLKTVAASYQGAVVTDLWHDAATDTDMVEVRFTTWHGAGSARVIYRGPVSGATPPRSPRNLTADTMRDNPPPRSLPRHVTGDLCRQCEMESAHEDYGDFCSKTCQAAFEDAAIDAAVTAAEIRAEEPPRFEQGERYAR